MQNYDDSTSYGECSLAKAFLKLDWGWALALWLWEEIRDLRVVSPNPNTVY